jgi:hypothetical protein
MITLFIPIVNRKSKRTTKKANREERALFALGGENHDVNIIYTSQEIGGY